MESTRELKAFNRLCSRHFACKADAQAKPELGVGLMLLQHTAVVVVNLYLQTGDAVKMLNNLNVISIVSKVESQPVWCS
ncbi:hypothetical protein CN032_08785 [Salmonella enterica subsp. enterica serovar Newport]|nr:hypothetical protein [Salmonella enterica subsp. enterica serovar Newport]EKT7007176.1 hypothetical protein [Salmonella enterica]ELP6559316.1 hypothetical protein [Salmonella enterica]ELV0714541.1 hypothetical protein [Salmonella enterica]